MENADGAWDRSKLEGSGKEQLRREDRSWKEASFRRLPHRGTGEQHRAVFIEPTPNLIKSPTQQDFRSSDGLYNLVKERYPDCFFKGQDLFDADLFRDPNRAAVFYTFMAELKTIISNAKITPTHEFLKRLDERGKLLRCYTQNIDCLERRLEMSSDLGDKKCGRVVQLHGDLDTVICTFCMTVYSFSEEYRAEFLDGTPPACPGCIEQESIRTALGKRTMPIGTLRPNIVLYNEHHAKGDQIADVTNYDLKRRPDLLIVMGTSLKIPGIKALIRALSKSVKTFDKGKVVFINNTEVSGWDDVFDFHIIGKTDDVVKQLEREVEKLEAISAVRAARALKAREEAKLRKERVDMAMAKQEHDDEEDEDVPLSQSSSRKTVSLSVTSASSSSRSSAASSRSASSKQAARSATLPYTASKPGLRRAGAAKSKPEPPSDPPADVSTPASAAPKARGRSRTVKPQEPQPPIESRSSTPPPSGPTDIVPPLSPSKRGPALKPSTRPAPLKKRRTAGDVEVVVEVVDDVENLNEDDDDFVSLRLVSRNTRSGATDKKKVTRSRKKEIKPDTTTGETSTASKTDTKPSSSRAKKPAAGAGGAGTKKPTKRKTAAAKKASSAPTSPPQEHEPAQTSMTSYVTRAKPRMSNNSQSAAAFVSL
ncbi:hypothetical protein HK104_000124 [Borealophlyctis nickersoniae]|nr:hypothetical protein HK104_000124 [Borealophlyctis nickersoniae]